MKIQLPENMVEIFGYHKELNAVLEEMRSINVKLVAYNEVIKGYAENLNFCDAFYNLCKVENDLSRRYLDLSFKRRELTNKINKCSVD